MSNRLKIKDSNKEVEINIDQDKVLDTVISGIMYEPTKEMIVKPLKPTMINKHFTEMVKVEPEEIDNETGFPKMTTKEYDKEVESAFRSGVVLKMPADYEGSISVGDTVVFANRVAMEFDLFKDSVLVNPHSIIAKVIK